MAEYDGVFSKHFLKGLVSGNTSLRKLCISPQFFRPLLLLLFLFLSSCHVSIIFHCWLIIGRLGWLCRPLAAQKTSFVLSDLIMFDYFMLIPEGEGQQWLHAIKLVKGQEMIIGRNRTTLHNDCASDKVVFISRNHVKIFWDGGDEVMITALTSAPGLVSVNDKELSTKTPANNNELSLTTVAHDGDIICLIKSEACFFYKLQGFVSKSLSMGGAVSGVEKEAGVKITTSGMDEGLVSKTECSICLLPIAFAHAVHPCGHHFCYTCIHDWSKVNTSCPSCQATVVGMNPSHVLNDIIEGVLSSSLDSSVLADWKERLVEGIARKKVDTSSSLSTPVASKSLTPGSSSAALVTSAPARAPVVPHNPAARGGSGAPIFPATSRKRPLADASAAASGTGKTLKMVVSPVIDLTDFTNGHNTGHSSNSAPTHCIAFHIQPDYKGLAVATVGMALKQALDSFDCNAAGLSNACWNPQRRCKHCRHSIARDSLVVSSVGPPCFQKLFHVQCLPSYNRGVTFMAGPEAKETICFEKVVNTGHLSANDVTLLRQNTAM